MCVSLYRESKGEAHDEVRTHLARLAKWPTEEVEVCHACTLGNEAPDADLCLWISISSGRQEGYVPLRRGRAAPALAKGKLERDQVSCVGADDVINVLRYDNHLWRSALAAHASARATMSEAHYNRRGGCIGVRWMGKDHCGDRESSEQQEHTATDKRRFGVHGGEFQGFPPFPQTGQWDSKQSSLCRDGNVSRE